MNWVFVLDASMSAAWLFEDEATDATRALLRILESRRAIVPALWHLEIRNLLLSAERRRRITPDKADELLECSLRLPIDTDVGNEEQSRSRNFALARAHRLTIYDAAYLELATRLHLPLATLDRALRESARNLGVKLA